jgi:hypothetical protein
MTITIIKDCSPYYITFTHDSFDNVVDYAKDIFDNGRAQKYEPPILSHIRQIVKTYKTEYYFLGKEDLEQMRMLSPPLKNLDINTDQQLYMHTLPGVVHPIHKDGPRKNPHGYSLNYPIRIQDECCITSWYADKNIDRYLTSNIFYPTGPLEILQSVTFKSNEAVLINGTIPHDWNNSQSQHDRVILTFRDANPSQVSFEDAKKKLFNL